MTIITSPNPKNPLAVAQIGEGLGDPGQQRRESESDVGQRVVDGGKTGQVVGPGDALNLQQAADQRHSVPAAQDGGREQSDRDAARKNRRGSP